MRRFGLSITLIAFLALSTTALWHHGYWGIIKLCFESFGTAQVLADLVIALSLFLIWMWRDARAAGRNPWPWLILTLTAGSFGPLIYILLYKTAKKDHEDGYSSHKKVELST